jgi:hypothetical protein
VPVTVAAQASEHGIEVLDRERQMADAGSVSRRGWSPRSVVGV